MAEQVIALAASLYQTAEETGFGFVWNPATANRPQLDTAIAGAAARYLENIVVRNDDTAIVLNIAGDATSPFSQSPSYDLSAAFETGGQVELAFTTSGTTHSFTFEAVWDANAADPYRLQVPSGRQAAFRTWRGNLPNTSADRDTVALTVTLSTPDAPDTSQLTVVLLDDVGAGTWTVPENVTSVEVQLVGGGGGGGNETGLGGGGGGGTTFGTKRAGGGGGGGAGTSGDGEVGGTGGAGGGAHRRRPRKRK